MKIFPAIDIKDKKCVRLVKGDFDNKTEYEMLPVEQAGKYKDHGFKNLHIVDLDGALTGKTVNLDIIKEIVVKYDLKIDVEYENDTVSKISTVMPDDSVFSWENKFSEYLFNETQIAIAHHIDGMMNENILWTLEDGFKDMSLGHPSWV